MVAVKKDPATGIITPCHSSGEVLKRSGQPAAQVDGLATISGVNETACRPGPPPVHVDGITTQSAVWRDERTVSRSRQVAPTHPAGAENIPAVRRKESSGRISLDDLFKKANRLSQLHKPHKANDVGWEAVERIRARDGELGLNHFKLLKRLGCGDIGTVYLAELRDTKFRFAMKVMDLGSLASHRKQLRAETERDILSILDHPFLPTLYAHFETPQFLCLVMEFCSGGDLHSLRQKQTGRFFPDKSARFYAAEILLALEYLHMMGVVYRDLKPENVLVRGDGHVMLSDFDLSLKCSVSPTILTPCASVVIDSSRDETDGSRVSRSSFSCLPRNMSRSRSRRTSWIHGAPTTRPAVDIGDLNFVAKSPPMSRWKPCLSKPPSRSNAFPEDVVPLPELVAEPSGVRSMSFVGTHEYLAPEIVAGDGHGSPVDWWTFGILLFELLYGKTPFKGAENEITLVNVLAQPLQFPEKGDPYYREVESSAKDLVTSLLVKDPQKRLGFNRGATEIKQHAFFEGINWALIRCTCPPQIPRSPIKKEKPAEKHDGLLPPSKLATIATLASLDQRKDSEDSASLHIQYF